MARKVKGTDAALVEALARAEAAEAEAKAARAALAAREEAERAAAEAAYEAEKAREEAARAARIAREEAEEAAAEIARLTASASKRLGAALHARSRLVDGLESLLAKVAAQRAAIKGKDNDIAEAAQTLRDNGIPEADILARCRKATQNANVSPFA